MSVHYAVFANLYANWHILQILNSPEAHSCKLSAGETCLALKERSPLAESYADNHP